MKSIGGYQIIKHLARGGMASIFLAYQESLKRHVVLKVLNPKLDDVIKQRFIEEGRIIASLDHPNIITVFDVVSTKNNHLLAMEYLEGGDLEARLKIGIDTYEALEIISKIADALHRIHKQGIIHGDIKPANVLFRKNGCPLITDFGISHQIKPKQEVDLGEGDRYASPTYASPELIQGRPFDYRTDMYSLGIMLFEMLTGEKPYKGDTEIEMIANSIQNPVPKLPAKLKDLQPLIDKLMAKQQENRLSDCKLVTRFVDQFLNDHPDLKKDFSETKLIDSDVIVEYVSKQKNRKDKSFSQFLSPILLSLILVLLIFVNKDTLINYWFNVSQTSHLHPKTPVTVVKISEPVETKAIDNDAVERLKQSEQDLQAQKAILFAQEQEIERVKEELKAQQRLALEAEKEKLLQAEREKQKNINQLLAKAKRSLKKYHLTTPLNNNALYYYQKVLEYDANNKKALKGIEEVVYRYEVLARGAIDKYNYQKAQQFISTGLNIDPDNEKLLELQKTANIRNEPKRTLNKVKNFFENW
jgi:serine/threonine-protein kinase PpkA